MGGVSARTFLALASRPTFLACRADSSFKVARNEAPVGLTLTPQPLNATDGQKSNCLLEFLCNSPGKTCDLSGNSRFSNIHFFPFGYQTLVTGTKTTLCFPRDVYHSFG